MVMPARESTAAVLLLLLVGDACAVTRYHRDADWRLLRRVVPAVLPGLVLGAALLAVLPEEVLRRGIGAVLLVLLLLQLAPLPRTPHRSRAGALGAGVAAGATTMVANAGGPVMTLYLLLQGVDKLRFLGTSAVFFAGVNLVKVPFVTGLGLVHTSTLLRTAVLVPAVLLGAWLGVRAVRRLGQRAFEVAVLVAGAASALALLLA
jgi:uncharacterized protein